MEYAAPLVIGAEYAPPLLIGRKKTVRTENILRGFGINVYSDNKNVLMHLRIDAGNSAISAHVM